ncbi:LacI family DNA-binding transcriptional regulator [Nakamurella flavida]
MADIARAAGVSVTTVSHVVNKTRPVAIDTERAVLAAIADRGYVPDNASRSMRSAGSQTIGLAMSVLSNPYFTELVSSIEQAVSGAGFSLLLAETHDDAAEELRAVTELVARKVEAVVLAPSADPSAALEVARQADIPVLLIDRFLDADVDQIASESVVPTAELVDHLAGSGHRRIAMISGLAGLSTTEERIAGFRLGMRRHRLRVDPELVVSGESDGARAEIVIRELLALPEPPTAVLVGNNQMTIGVIRGAGRAGVDVPGDLAVVSFDDFEWADLFHPRLTVVAQPVQAMGQQAVSMVMSRLRDRSLPARRVVLRPTFVHRDSCGCHRDSIVAVVPTDVPRAIADALPSSTGAA